jgi:hypothetical protein
MQLKNTVLKLLAKKGDFGLDRDNRQKVQYLLLLRTKFHQCQSNLVFQMLEKITQFLFRTDQSSIVSQQFFSIRTSFCSAKNRGTFFLFLTRTKIYMT